MTGMVGEKPKKWIRGIMSFEKRKQWESMFEDGIVVEGINLGESSILEASYDSDSDDDDDDDADENGNLKDFVVDSDSEEEDA